METPGAPAGQPLDGAATHVEEAHLPIALPLSFLTTDEIHIRIEKALAETARGRTAGSVNCAGCAGCASEVA